MAIENASTNITLLSAADFSTTGQHRFGTINSSGQIGLTSSAGRVDGVIEDDPAAINRATTVAISGVCKLLLGGSVTAGGDIQSGASGVGVSGSTNAICTALETGVSGDIISVLLK